MELNMNKYTYEVFYDNGYSRKTDNYQESIDMFNESNSYIRVSKPADVTFSRRLYQHTDIHIWSEMLIDEMPNNRIEKRIMTAMLNKEAQERHSQHIMNMEAEYQAEIEWSGSSLTAQEELSASREGLPTTDFHGDFSKMSEELKDSIINPKHYKIFSPEDYAEYPDGIEYMDLCDKALAHLSGVESHLVGQILKYTLRVGKKDDMEQDATKIEWYASRLVKCVKGKK